MSTHTPLPWEPVDISTGNSTRRVQLVHEGRGVMILQHDGSNEGLDNECFLIRACNNHTAMLEALREQVSMLRELMEYTLANTTIRDLCLRDVLERGEQAIAQAEQGG
jgi:hypothetical protein